MRNWKEVTVSVNLAGSSYYKVSAISTKLPDASEES